MLRLLDLLFPPRVDDITLRSVTDDAFLASLSPRIVPHTRPATVVLLPFADPGVRAAIHEAKYHGTGRAFELLALALAEYLRDADMQSHMTSIVPVPLGKERRKERGFNQAEEVARRACRLLTKEGVHSLALEPDLLIRTRETASQVSLPQREREENMRGAFGAARSPDPSHTYIVIDDVTTTGATLQAAVDALASAGAVHIIPLALAH